MNQADNDSKPRPGPRDVAGELRAALWKYRHPIAFEIALGAFEGLLIAFGLLNAVKAMLILPVGLVLFLVGRWLLEKAAGQAMLFQFSMRHLMLGVVGAAVAFVMAREFGWSVLLLPILILPPLVVMFVALKLSGHDAAQRDALLSVLALAVRRDAPLGPAASAFAGLCRGSYRHTVTALADRLEAGASLPQALDDVPGALPSDASAVARAGWASGTLAPALDEAVAAREARRLDGPRLRAVFGYPLLVLFFLVLSATFLMEDTLPRLLAIYRDFGQEMTVPTRTMLHFLKPASDALRSIMDLGDPGISVGLIPRVSGPDPFATSFLLLLLALMNFAVVVGLLFGAWWVARRVLLVLGGGLDAMSPARSGRRSMFARLAPPDFRRDSATTLRALAVAVEGGRPLPDALDVLDGRDLGRTARRQLRLARGDVHRGRDWLDALRTRGLVRPGDALVLETATRAGNLAWALRERAAAAERMENHRLRAWGQVLRPLTLILLGLFVLGFALIYFQPLTALIQSIAEEVP